MAMPAAIAAGIPRGMRGRLRRNTPAGAPTPRIAGARNLRPGSSIESSASSQMPVPTP
jgi:hypothetical protein